LRNCKCSKVRITGKWAKEETVWKQITEGAMIHGFGENSHNTHDYYTARSGDIHNLTGISEQQRQLNYNQRIEEFEATLLSSIAELVFSVIAGRRADFTG
jgi:hypothetical protein